MNERPMRMWLNRLEEPKLVFAGENFHHDPKIALMKWGPFGFDGSEKIIKLGLVCPKSELESVRQWFRRLETPLIDSVQNVLKFPNFPGLSKTLRCKFEIPDNCVRILPERDLGFALAATGVQQFDSLLDLYSDSIQTLFGDSRPDVVLVCFPEEVADLRIQNQRISGMELGWMRKRQKEDDASQLSLFETSSEQDASAAAEIFPQAEELLFRNFHRALKAKCMMLSNAVPLQILRQHTYISTAGKQNDATRAWNLSTALYYKAANIPWQPHGLESGTCFVGISFHYLKRQRGDILFASLAQAYSTDTEPFAIQGEPLSDRQS